MASEQVWNLVSIRLNQLAESITNGTDEFSTSRAEQAKEKTLVILSSPEHVTAKKIGAVAIAIIKKPVINTVILDFNNVTEVNSSSWNQDHFGSPTDVIRFMEMPEFLALFRIADEHKFSLSIKPELSFRIVNEESEDKVYRTVKNKLVFETNSLSTASRDPADKLDITENLFL